MIALKFLLFLLSLGAVGFFGYKSLRRTDKGKIDSFNIPTALLGVAIFIAINFFLAPSFGQVPAGHRGVVLEFGKVTNRILGEGIYMVTPFVNSVELMDVQVHAASTPAAAASRDLQDVATNITVNYRLDGSRVAEVYRDLRHDYVDRIMNPAVQEAVKSATAQFDAERLIIERPRVKFAIEDYLRNTLGKHGLLVDNISITDFKFSSDFANAIEAKVTSTQLALKAKNDADIVANQQLQKYSIAKADSYTVVTNAKAEAEAIKIKVTAINAQGGKDYVQLKAVEKWDGSVPTYMMGNSVPFVNLNAGK